MADDSMCLRPAVELAAMLRAREISSRELLELHLDRIERINPGINAVITLEAEKAREQAEDADHRLARANAADGQPLLGLPMTIKDAIEVGGMRSTGGAAALANHVPVADAPAVARLRAAGAVVMGKTNVPEWSGDIQTFNALFGTTNNPWDPSRTTGGSSGGPAAAVATGMSSFELGTDIGGSIRIPSSYCGVCGHKPSFGVVSQRGYLDSPQSIDGGSIDADINVFGPIARSVSDLEMLLDVLAGPEEEAAAALNLRLPPARHASISDYRIGLWLDDPTCSVDSEALKLLQGAAEALAASGAKVHDARPPLELAEVRALFDQLILPAISVSFEGELGTALGGNHRTWLDLNRRRAAVRRVWADWFRDYDVLLCPVLPMLPFPHDQAGTITDRLVTINGQTRPHADALAWTGLVGVAYLPSTVVPVGRAGGLPVGVQVVGPYLEDRTALFVAARLAEMTGGYVPHRQPRPDGDEPTGPDSRPPERPVLARSARTGK